MSTFAFSDAKLKSVILPGWGEASMEQHKRSRFFLSSDALLWIGAIGGNWVSNGYQSDYTAFALQHANIDITVGDYLYSVDVGHYDNIIEYNEVKERQRSQEIELYPDGSLKRESGHEIYPEGEGFDWHWDFSSNRQSYNSMRIKSGSFKKYSNFAIAGLIINRVISFIDVLYLERTGKKTFFSTSVLPSGKDGMRWQISIPIH